VELDTVPNSIPLFVEIALPAADPREALALGIRADALGFDGVTLPDHFFQPKRFESVMEGRAELFVTLGALARETSRVRLGQAMVCAAFHHPVQIARAIATLDQLSNGRAELGIGSGWYHAEFEALGILFRNASERQNLLGEALEVIRRYWEEPILNFEGRFFRLQEVFAQPKPIQKPHPPIVVGGGSPGLLAVAAKVADVVNVVPPLLAPGGMDLRRGLSTSVDVFRRRVENVSKALTDVGRPLNSIAVGINLQVLVAREAASVERALALASASLGLDALTLRESPMTLVGTPDECLSKLRKLREVLGFSRISLAFLIPGQLETFGEDVLPLLRAQS